MVELPKPPEKERAYFPFRRHPVVERPEKVEVSPELEKEGVKGVPLPGEKFEAGEDGGIRPLPETKISIPGATKADVSEGIRWARERLRRLQLKRQEAGI